MADINFDDISKTISDAAEAVGKKTEAFIKIQKIRGQMHAAKHLVEKNYKDLGEIIFRRYAAGEAVDEEVAIICEEVSQINANLAELREELAKARGCRVCPACEAEVPWEAEYCMKCGSPIPESQDEEVQEPDADTSEDESEEAKVPNDTEAEVSKTADTAETAETEANAETNTDVNDSVTEETAKAKSSEDNIL